MSIGGVRKQLPENDACGRILTFGLDGELNLSGVCSSQRGPARRASPSSRPQILGGFGEEGRGAHLSDRLLASGSTLIPGTHVGV